MNAAEIVGIAIGVTALAVAWVSLYIASRAARNDVVSELRSWADDVIHLLSDASELCGLEGTNLKPDELLLRSSQLAAKTSALWDRGRFFFTNVSQDICGTEKPSAFTGFRPPILDLLMLSYELCRRIDIRAGVGDQRRCKAFIYLKREFVSAIQTVIVRSPLTLRRFEKYLPTVQVEALPREILTLAGAENRRFQLKFNNELLIEGKRHFVRGTTA